VLGRKSGRATRKTLAKAEKQLAKADKEATKAATKAAKKAEKTAVDVRTEAEKAAVEADRQAKKAAADADLKTKKAAADAASEAAKTAWEAAAVAKRLAVPPRTLLEHATRPWDLRRMLATARIIGPLVAPFALQAATASRGWWDERRARQLGVSTVEVAAYRGPTGPTEARLAGLAHTVQDLQRRRGGDLQVVRFAELTNNRLADLTIATRAAASMPSGRRRPTLTAVGRDLDRIDADLMTFLLPGPPAASAALPSSPAASSAALPSSTAASSPLSSPAGTHTVTR
jgi:hypothetical protein